jgi:hypothetical protein
LLLLLTLSYDGERLWQIRQACSKRFFSVTLLLLLLLLLFPCTVPLTAHAHGLCLRLCLALTHATCSSNSSISSGSIKKVDYAPKTYMMHKLQGWCQSI